jgi:long-chain acyl-CoA synthetase
MDARSFIAGVLTSTLLTCTALFIGGWIATNAKTGATIETLRNDPDLIAVIQTAVDEANKAVSKAESIRKFTILPVDFTIAGGQLTAKLSLKRHVIAEQFAAEISALFTK